MSNALSDLRLGALALLGEGPLLLSLQGRFPHRLLVARCRDARRLSEVREAPVDSPRRDTRGRVGIQDSTPILEALEQRFPESVDPSRRSRRRSSSRSCSRSSATSGATNGCSICAGRGTEDCLSAGGRIAASMVEAGDEAGADRDAREGDRAHARPRRVRRLERRDGAADRAVLPRRARDSSTPISSGGPISFGGRPCFADFGLWGQIYEAWTDPTGGAWIERSAPRVLDWVQRMLWPRSRGSLRELVSPRPDARALPGGAGRRALLSLDPRQRGGPRGRSGGIQRRARGPAFQPEAPEIPCPLAGRAAYALCGVADKSSLDPDSRADGLPRCGSPKSVDLGFSNRKLTGCVATAQKTLQR